MDKIAELQAIASQVRRDVVKAGTRLSRVVTPVAHWVVQIFSQRFILKLCSTTRPCHERQR